jgi:plastocyanin
LENRLREMVCEGSLDLMEAQRDRRELGPKMKRIHFLTLLCGIGALAGCSPTRPVEQTESQKKPEPSYFKVDPSSAGQMSGAVRFTGRKPPRKTIDMSGDPACVEAHHGKALDESVVVNPNGTLANVFIYIKSGLEGKTFEIPNTPVTLDQRGCWFHPRVMGIQAGQALEITNSDPVTHNVHPLAQVNREWNHSQGAGESPLARKFARPEVMIPVKCNIHSWMRAFIGVVDHPYFAFTGTDGAFQIPNVPPGDYLIGAWHERLGTQEQKITVPPSGKIEINFTFKGE